MLLARFHVLDVGLTVYITFLYSIPSVALVPLIVLWAGYETTAKVIILFLFAFFPMVINTYQGVKSVDLKLLEVGRAFRCSERQLWANIVLPGALPFIVTGIRLAVGRGMIGMVLADLYTAISGIGYLIVRTASTFQVDKMFVPIVTLGLLGVTLTALLRLAERYVGRGPLRARKIEPRAPSNSSRDGCSRGGEGTPSADGCDPRSIRGGWSRNGEANADHRFDRAGFGEILLDARCVLTVIAPALGASRDGQRNNRGGGERSGKLSHGDLTGWDLSKY